MFPLCLQWAKPIWGGDIPQHKGQDSSATSVSLSWEFPRTPPRGFTLHKDLGIWKD
jgi:hypothetical protein